VTVSSMPAAQARDENDPDPTRGRRTATDKRPHVRMTAGFFTRPGKLTHIADPVERMAALALLAASIGMYRARTMSMSMTTCCITGPPSRRPGPPNGAAPPGRPAGSRAGPGTRRPPRNAARWAAPARTPTRMRS
jgi:hypothetical protein